PRPAGPAHQLAAPARGLPAGSRGTAGSGAAVARQQRRHARPGRGGRTRRRARPPLRARPRRLTSPRRRARRADARSRPRRAPPRPRRTGGGDRQRPVAPCDPRPRAGRAHRGGHGRRPRPAAGGRGRRGGRHHRRGERGVTPRRLACLSAIFVLLSSGAYVFIYLYRWEWNRALIAGVLFVATEVGLVGALILDRLRGIERRLDAATSRHSQALARDVALGHLQASAPTARNHFAWLRPRPEDSTINGIAPVLMGAGVGLSALAWLVGRVP